MADKFIEVIERAELNGELYELFKCDDSYVCDENGKYYLASSPLIYQVHPNDVEPINFPRLVGALGQVYIKKENKNEKHLFVLKITEGLKRLLQSEEAIQIYIATEIFAMIYVKSLEDKYYMLREVVALILEDVKSAISKNNEKLANTAFFLGKYCDDGLLGIIKKYNNDIIKAGGTPIIGGPYDE